MMNTIRQRIFSNWHFARILRLAISGWILVLAIQSHDVLMGLFGVFFLYTALAGVGCCGVNSCYTSPPKTGNTENSEHIEYEEIK
ncbi:MAG TPA: hypothetical protein VHE59_06670 [Mucilaginibacter sp.]|nr:hypothetical protein [Mucilaginibacter sp.]